MKTDIAGPWQDVYSYALQELFDQMDDLCSMDIEDFEEVDKYQLRLGVLHADGTATRLEDGDSLAVRIEYLRPSEEADVEICPKCGASCNGDVTIADHGMCRDCLAAWQFGEGLQDRPSFRYRK